MSTNQDLEIQKLKLLLEEKDAAHREVLRSKEEDLRRAKAEISHLQSSVYQSQSQVVQPSGQSNLDASSAVHNEFQLPSTPATPATPFHQDGMSRSNTVPRSNGMHGYSRHEGAARPSNRHSHDGGHAVKRARTMSQQAPVSQKMDRLGSNLSTQSAGPFTGNVPISPPPRIHNAGVQMRNAGMAEYVDKDEPVSSYALAHSQSLRSQSSKHRHDMPTLSETGPMTGVMLDPEVFFSQHPFSEEPPQVVDSFGSSVPSQNHDVDVPQFNITNVSVCGSMTTAPTYDTAPMTRQNSLFDNQSVSGGVRMMSLGSQMSQAGEAYYQDGTQQNCSSGDNSPLGKRPYCSEDALIAVGSSLAPPFAHQYAASAPTDVLLSSSDMERSVSSASMASTRSSSSLKVRAKDTLKLQCQRALNAPLKPKPSTEQMPGESQANTKKDGKTAITKTKYVRPKQPKVFCDQCDEHKDGFRGEHELRRHRDAKHQTTVKKWICVDPAAHGLPIGIPAVNPLSKCKACKAQKKYGAYYNAAAHLRRTHFKEKPSRQKNKGNGNNRSDEDKRGGKGGGDWPPMSELKNWMKEIWVNKYELDDDDDGEDELSHPVVDPESGVMESYPGEFNIPHKMSGNMFGEVDYSNLVVNGDVAYMNGMPLSSADFNFNNAMSPTTISPNFAPDLSAIAPQDHMNQFSSALSSSATVTPMTVYHEVPHHMDDFDFNMVYTQ
ncbi:uncharacterized protein F4807DRAFT_330061 [Annulohypoxylon truncatum]|uniref:uncharacterized protein n=1 Tax=Annulohypoxylon truncatum TaxID=327061 RepID=UPI002007FED3|nr:uncharacterized protein F4807DRAFT_330061 [Annulohypoxylon truncatum]KAI1204481.1 hypothetical protein F4807DRAFT_330061 [Annulohypoxylon truncatum]